ncbi:hypothetical protein FIBSPDRAFT_901603 [Athelia psychrophila]|uniref:Acid protease n=1 Tax=Athelia psychrophila TaxID=1759441 RepID=A0A165WY37_9AGAM|nr:hypothetical protein FIBSPDRAFT_901603 [Fibularhizoctonia sp. CBS 109695]
MLLIILSALLLHLVTSNLVPPDALFSTMKFQLTSPEQNLVNLTIGGQTSDLWVHVQDQLNTNRETDVDIPLNYEIGSASGNVVYGAADLGGYVVHSQVSAFLDVNEVTDQMGRERSAQPFMCNIFDQHPTLPKFIAISVERSNDKEEESGGSLHIGEYDPSFSAVAESPMLPVAHPQAARWTVVVDSMHINNKNGTSLAYISSAAVDYIYENIPGSMRLLKNGQSSWAVPCMEPANLSLFLGPPAVATQSSGDSFAVHPLELTVFKTIVEDGQQWTIFTNAFQAQLSVGATDLDFLLGDIFMRNVYSVSAVLLRSTSPLLSRVYNAHQS